MPTIKGLSFLELTFVAILLIVVLRRPQAFNTVVGSLASAYTKAVGVFVKA
jgi:hypothetical protein